MPHILSDRLSVLETKIRFYCVTQTHKYIIIHVLVYVLRQDIFCRSFSCLWNRLVGRSTNDSLHCLCSREVVIDYN